MKSQVRFKDAKISQKGQITIPKEVREKLGVDAGDRVVFFFDDGQQVKMTNTENAEIKTKNNNQVGNIKKEKVR